ncbi:NPP1 family protein [Streptomyces sp. NBC_01294]|uniref:NPP1 family protein n=1 Tax=Streptomyces sp. NBC_01294 TaxID=2903815 RepID=UPI003FA3693D
MTISQIAGQPNRSVLTPRMRRRGWGVTLASALGAFVLTLSMSTPAQAEIITNLPQKASGLEQTFSPAYDYDGNGCYATAALRSDWRLNSGLPLGGGGPDVNCHDRARLDNSNTYSREKCNNGWCAIMYASYFEKDQVGTCAPNACAGHTHDFEHVIVWVQNNQVKYVSVSCHAGWSTFGRSSIRFDPSGTHPKIVYHQDGGSTHCFRIANSGDEAVENVTGGWVYPRLVGWEGYNDVDHRNHFIYSQSTKNHFGSASIKLGTGTIENQLASAQAKIDTPIAFNPYG